MAWFRKKKTGPAATAGALREAALSVKAADIGLARVGAGPKVFGALMETAYPEAVATLVCFADGTTSLYYSNGGGVIGAGDHESVRKASTAFLALAEEHVAQLAPATFRPYPTLGHTRFYIHTFDGLLTAEAPEEALGNNLLPLSPVFHGAHSVIAAIRELDLLG